MCRPHGSQIPIMRQDARRSNAKFSIQNIMVVVISLFTIYYIMASGHVEESSETKNTLAKYRILVVQQDSIGKCSAIDIFIIRLGQFEEVMDIIHRKHGDAKNKDKSLILTLSFHDVYSSAMLEQQFLMAVHQKVSPRTLVSFRPYTHKWEIAANFGDHKQLQKHIAPYRYSVCFHHEILEDVSRIVDSIYHN